MSRIKYNGNEYKTGDILNVSFKEGKFLECVAHVENSTLFICNNSPNYAGGTPEKKHGKRYAFPIKIKNGKSTKMNDNIIILKGEKFKSFKISEKINSFFNQYYKDYRFLLNTESDVLSLYDHINEPKDLFEMKDGFVVLHSKERKKMLKIRLGRLMRKLINKYNEKIKKENTGTDAINVNDEFIEKLHNQWVAHINEVNFVFAEGKDILKGYTTANYHKSGKLSSCMNNAFDRLKFYTKFPDKIKLLILYYQGQVAGRSLVWHTDDGKIYHDRIYVAFDWVANSMRQIFKKEGIEEAYGKALKLKVSLEGVTQYENLPYLDTFRSFNWKKGCLSTYTIS